MSSRFFVGLMSGTSLDGADAVLVEFSPLPRVAASAHRPFDPGLRSALADLTAPGPDELDRAARLGNELAHCYARAVADVLRDSGVRPGDVAAVGCHGQTVRHRPDLGYTVQIGNGALLAELTSLRVVCDFRSRDVAAGGQGAPLVPAFHAGAFGSQAERRAVVNIGGIANVSLIDRDGRVRGFDSGPGNCLMDRWVLHHLGTPLDDGGAWAAGGSVLPDLLQALLGDPYFSTQPPKSTGRELFNDAWLRPWLPSGAAPQDVQATLLELTARSIGDAVLPFRPARAIACGGGTANRALMRRLASLLGPIPLETSDRHGIDPQLVEAVAFAWLAAQACDGKPGNLPSVTGARGLRVLGAIYPG